MAGELLREIDQHIKAGLSEFQLTVHLVEGRASKVLGAAGAGECRWIAGGLQGTLREEIAAARLVVQQMVEEIREDVPSHKLGTLVCVGRGRGSDGVRLPSAESTH